MMTEQCYWRASYNEKLDCYVVNQAGWIASGQPILSYRFIYRDQMGYLAKRTAFPQTTLEETYAFGEYATYADFKQAIEAICQQAEQRRELHNIDYFLAIVNIIIERMIAKGLGDLTILADEQMCGLFVTGIEDAYTLRDESLVYPLHDRVFCAPRCWRLFLRQVIAPSGVTRGWGIFVLWYPQFDAQATDETVYAADTARILTLHQSYSREDAHLFLVGVEDFMIFERHQDPAWAYETDTDVLAHLAINLTQYDTINSLDSLWQPITGQVLQDFYNKKPVVCEDADWLAEDADPSVDYAKKMGVPLHVADQHYAEILDGLRDWPDNQGDAT